MNVRREKERERFSHLYYSHGQAGLLRQLLPDVSGGLRGRREGRLQDLQLFRLYSGPRAASFRAGTAVAAATAGAAVRALVLRLAVPRLGIAVQGTFNRTKPSYRVTVVPTITWVLSRGRLTGEIGRRARFVYSAIESFTSALNTTTGNLLLGET